MNLIELKDIHVHFPSRDGKLFSSAKVKAVQGVNFAIRAGETVGVVGESGCGKSTLANVVIGLQKPTHGEVRFRDQRIQHGSANMRRIFGRQV